MRTLPPFLCAVAILASGCNSAAVSAPTARNAPFVLIVPYFSLVGDVSSSKSVSVYKVDAATGKLTLVPGSPFAAGLNPIATAVTPNGRFAYVVNKDSSSVSAYRIDATTGALTASLGSPFAVADWSSNPLNLVLDAAGRHAYAVSGAGVSAFTIDPNSGALKTIAGSPFANDPSSAYATAAVAVNPSDTFAYVLNYDRNTVDTYAIDPGGALKRVASSPDAGQITNDMNPLRSVTLDPNAKFAYVTTSCCVYLYAIDPTTGALTISAHIGLGAAFSLEGFAIGRSGAFAYALNGSRVYAYRIDATSGTLRALQGPAFTTATGMYPSGVTIDPTGKFAYVFAQGKTPRENKIYAYRIDPSTGALRPLMGSPYAVPASAIDPVARWFNVNRCATFGWDRPPQPPQLERASETIVFDRIPAQVLTRSRYFFDPTTRSALHVPRADSGVVITLREVSGQPPAGTPRLDLSSVQTTSGIKLGSSAESVVRILGEPKIVSACNQELYVYLRDEAYDTLRFTISGGRVTEISEDFGG
ncbi:MAG: beta-propeller fold lactonase family protein [Candidatus Eremiobacteraeota bacterium]|nr:beta-propeller fold lactonase family protein [Candidatus Eremiobacteraeota bacterium]